MSKKSSTAADQKLLESLKASVTTKKAAAPAGKQAVGKVIASERNRATIPFNIRLNADDSDKIETIVDALRAGGKRRASSADAVRVALRALSDKDLNRALSFLD